MCAQGVRYGPVLTLDLPRCELGVDHWYRNCQACWQLGIGLARGSVLRQRVWCRIAESDRC